MDKNGRFGRYTVGAPSYGAWEGLFLQDPPAPMQNYNRTRCFFKIPPLGRAKWLSVRGGGVPNIQKGITPSLKREPIFTSPPKYLVYLDEEFDGDFIFAIRHDIIL